MRCALLIALIFLFAASTAAAPSSLDSQLGTIMQGRRGTAVLIAVANGDVLAAYHPEVAARRLALPGSTVKTFTLLALLKSGKVKAEERFLCRRNVRVGKANLTCSHPQTGQPFDAVSALAYSCNDYFSSMATRLTAQELRDAFIHSGLTSQTKLVPNEATGSVVLTQTREQRQLQAVGEFGIHVTPLELLLAFRMLAQRRRAADLTDVDRTVFAGLEAGTDYGMARLAQPKGLRVAGKTGTCRAEEGAWSHGWFAGFAPAGNPKVAVVVFLERGTGPGDAAPLAAQILQAWMAEPK
ncbi:MAG: penicillin-binding transpeptidase domain-containing protein [Terriglobales bacterium]